MASASIDVEHGLWKASGHDFTIEYSMYVLEQIRAAAIEGFNKLPRGGIEIGGVLFGSREGRRISVRDFRALDCEYSLGPSFTLSEKDQAKLKQLLDVASSEPELRGLIAVGWYHAHTRSEIRLTDR